MRKTFSWFMALFTGIVLLVTGCSNASQITFKDPTSEHNFMPNGSAAVTVNTAFGNQRSTIFPEDMSEEAKGQLLYKLTGNSGGSSVPENTIFTYDEIISKKAVVPLPPLDGWSFDLKAYQVDDVTASDRASQVAGGSEVLTATQGSVNLTTGNQTVTFNLADVITDANARGNVDVTLNFYNKGGAITGVKFEVISGFNGEVTIKDGSAGKPVVRGADFLVDGSTEISSGLDGTVKGWAKIVPMGKNWSQAYLIGKLPVGEHELKYTFYTLNETNTGGSTASEYTRVGGGSEKILITGGNKSKATITRDEKSMNEKIPTAPSNFAYSVSFEPEAGTVVTLSDGTKAQILDDDLSSSAANVHGFYNLKFTWRDESDTESMFKIRLSDGESLNESAIIITPTTHSLDSAVTVAKDSDPAVTGTAYDSEYSNISLVSGSLASGSTSVVLKVPTKVKFQKAQIIAANEITESTKTYDTTGTSDKIEKTKSEGKSIGMATISYGLTSKAPAKVAKINYTEKSDPSLSKATDGVSNLYFIMGYDLGSGTITPINSVSYPYVSLDGSSSDLVFKEWKINDSYIADGDAQGLALGNTITGNTIVYPVWTVNTTVALKFPSYNNYRDVALLTGDTNDAPILFDYKTEKAKAVAAESGGGDGKAKIVIKANKLTGGTSAPASQSFKFNVVRDSDNTVVYDGGTTTSTPSGQISVLDDTLTWITDAPEFNGGVYRVIVSFDYYPDGTDGPFRNISGTVYVNLVR